jgi:phage-related protein
MSKTNITPEINLALQEEELSFRKLIVVELDPLDESKIYRFVANDNQNVTVDGKLYYAAEIEITPMETATDGKVEKLTVGLSNKAQNWAAIFAANGTIINANKLLYIYEWYPDFPNQLPVEIYRGVMDAPRMTISNFEVDVQRSKVDFEQESPLMTYEPPCQWKFKTWRCGYSGSAIRCDYSLYTCLKYGNVLNFGGHPFVAKAVARASVGG